MRARWQLSYDRGSICLESPARGQHPTASADPHTLPPQAPVSLPFLRWDVRIHAFRCLAMHYRPLLRALIQQEIPHHDAVRGYVTLSTGVPEEQPPLYVHQAEALTAWQQSKRGVVELPTGAGKTRLALEAIQQVGKSTLVLVPTIALVLQWEQLLHDAFCSGSNAPTASSKHSPTTPPETTPDAAPDHPQVGVLGGGRYDLQPLTVSTYASAARHVEHFGNAFCLAVFDECHHLGASKQLEIAEKLIAPYRLGLTATLHRPDGRHRLLQSTIGPTLYRSSIRALSGKVLAPYQVRTHYADLQHDEAQCYQQARAHYLHYRRQTSAPGEHWQRFVQRAAVTLAGRKALAAYHLQRRLALAPEAKFALCGQLLWQHRGARVLIFTNDNPTALRLSETFMLPLITHETSLAERKTIMSHFAENHWPVLVTSRVLNEGVDLPAVKIAVVFSGTSSVREHVQRLGRILRRAQGEHAILYELLTRGTTETTISQRRRMHDAYTA